jgi:LuxR family maltose regulon positive regulatory protein
MNDWRQKNMTHLLLSTKLFFPRARANLVPRPRLIEQLNAGLHKPLTLISAPAGYGKTTLISDWRASRGSEYPLAWLSLDPDDDNLERFLSYVSAALETLDPKLAQDLNAQLYSPQLPPLEELITILINGVDAFPLDFALVLDDCHVITDPAIHATLAYLLDHLPPNMHLVMLTRADPPIHLAKLRARGDLVELRADDLRFTVEETTRFLNAVMRLNLSAENMLALEQRTEGWIVGLQMAALSMRGNREPAAFIKAFTGTNRHILDFLTEEVIQLQPEPVQAFLLKTSILNRLTGPLCDAILGDAVKGIEVNGAKDGEISIPLPLSPSPSSSQSILDYLDRSNLFLIPLDDQRKWYRYHRLFSDLLFQYLKQTSLQRVNELYALAATWHEQNGYLDEAVGYALKAQNFELATRLMNQIRTNLLNHGEVRSLLKWIRILPEDLVRSQPELSFSYASYLTMLGYFDAAEKWLQLAETGIGQLATSEHHISLNEHRFIIYRSVYARFRGDFPAAVHLAERAFELVPVTMVRDWGISLLFLGQAQFYAGNTEAAERVLSVAIQANLASGHFEAYVDSCHHLAKLRVLQGRLNDARDIYEQTARVVSEHATPVYAGTEHAGLGDLKRESNQLQTAAVEIEKGIELAEAGDHIFSLTEVYLARLRLALSQKDWEMAELQLEKAEQGARRCPTSIEIPYLQAWQARLHLAQGKLVEAASWAGTKEQGGAGPFDFYKEFELLTLARVWLAEGKTDQATSLLERLRAAALIAGRYGRAIEAQMLQALADQAAGLEIDSIEELSQVLVGAEAEGYVRLFVDEGAPMVKLLLKVSREGTSGIRDYARRLLESYSQEQVDRLVPALRKPPGETPVEPLSKREIEVLRLIADGCSNKEIASQLFISIGTVKRHIIHIFQKLDAANRTQAVAIARERKVI